MYSAETKVIQISKHFPYPDHFTVNKSLDKWGSILIKRVHIFRKIHALVFKKMSGQNDIHGQTSRKIEMVIPLYPFLDSCSSFYEITYHTKFKRKWLSQKGWKYTWKIKKMKMPGEQMVNKELHSLHVSLSELVLIKSFLQADEHTDSIYTLNFVGV